MTKEQYDQLKPGDLIEFLDIKYQRIGCIIPIIRKTKSKNWPGVAFQLPNHQEITTVTNLKRIELPKNGLFPAISSKTVR